ncbi:hypothetical protein [Polycyclovorans algicola]|uniref:hypothetical protein n=1 Tax=Polycyclovorans algicola TaxID=616992 RepID=UPI001377E76F|nr:hypothetical protein [Polycyclovorans algicola]
MTHDEANEIFGNWYNACIENGISPEDVVKQIGGMALITDEDLVEKLENEGLI